MNDPRLIELVAHATRLYGRSAAYIVLIAPLDGGKLQSLGNVPTDSQVEILRAFLRSFEAGTAAYMGPIAVPEGTQ